MYRGDFEHIVVGQGWKNTGERAGEHRLTGAGRTIEDDVVATGGGYFERALRALLPLHIGKIECGRGRLHAAVAHEAREWLLPF